MTAKLESIIEEFADLAPRERLELLLDFAEELPELPAKYRGLRDAGRNRVLECQSPVFLWVELDQGLVQVFADAPPEAPTVRGFVGIVVEGFSGTAPQEVLAFRGNLVQRLGLVDALGMVRMQGLSAILNRIRYEVHAAAERETSQ